MPCNKSIEERFWAKVNKTETCWLWTASTASGYGAFWFPPSQVGAHVASWRFHFGEVPNGLHVLHKCDVKLCVRPAHLFIGTNLDNILDMRKKGREAKGVLHGQAVMTDDKVREMRRKHRAGDGITALANEYHIGTHTTWCICHYKTWKHVKDFPEDKEQQCQLLLPSKQLLLPT